MNSTSIVTGYEVCDMSPEEIAEAEGLDLETVKITLKHHSMKYRKDVKQGRTEDVSEDEYEQILTAYKELALYSDSDFVKERALRQLMNEKKGRNDPKSRGQHLRINVLQVNNLIRQARGEKKELEVVDV